MKRYRAFDPPEYQNWEPDPEMVREFEQTLREPARAALIAELSEDDFLAFYRDLLTTRLHDIGLKRWVRQGVISKAWLSTGEEAVTVGNVRALDPTRDMVSPMIRNAGACHMMGCPWRTSSAVTSRPRTVPTGDGTSTSARSTRA